MALALTVTHIYERGKEEGRIQLLGIGNELWITYSNGQRNNSVK
jgi:hypothetical protein